LILSGGRGTRLRPLTYTNAKQLVPIANKPILFYGIEDLRRAGITQIGIVVGDTRKEVRAAVGDGSRWGVEVTYVEQEEPLGLAHALLIAQGFLQGERFVMYLGDNLILGGIAKLAEEFRRSDANAQILLARVPNPQQFGVAVLERDRVVRLVEKPKQPPSDLALVGVYMFDKNVFEAAGKISPSWRNELEITDAIQTMIEDGNKVDYRLVTGWWKDTGKLEDLLEANRIILDTFENRRQGTVDAHSKVDFKVVLEPGSQVEGSVIRGPAIVGGEARIVNSYIGPFTAIGERVHIENSEIEHSIVMEECVIRNVNRRIVDSLLGKRVVVTLSDEKPAAYRFMLGDSSTVGI